MKTDVIVIGGGHNGLTTACLLAKKGKRVTLLEKRAILGGLAASESFGKGYRTGGLLQDTAGVRSEVIDALGLERYGLKVERTRPQVFFPGPEGSRGVILNGDHQKTASELSHFSKKDGESYLAYRNFAERTQNFMAKIFNETPPGVMAATFIQNWEFIKNAWSFRLLGKHDMLEILRVAPMCVADWVDEWFETQFFKAGLVMPALYGTFSGPWSPGSAANLLIWESTARLSITGGGPSLISALTQAAKALGVDIRTEAEVKEVLVDRKGDTEVVRGVTLKSGETLEAGIVAASCHPKHLFLDLVPYWAVTHQFSDRIEHVRSRGTAAIVHLAIDRPVEWKGLGSDRQTTPYIRLASSIDGVEKAFDAIKYGNFSQDPVLDVSVPTLKSPDYAPKNHEVLSVLVHFVPEKLGVGAAGPTAQNPGTWTDEAKSKLLKTVLAKLDTYTTGVSKHVLEHQLLTPQDLEKDYNLPGGNLYHGEPALDQLLVRPTPETAQFSSPIRGLYLCGSGSHPGGGLTCAPGALAAKEI